MSKIYVAWHEGGYGSSGYVEKVSINKLELIKKLCSELSQNADIKIYDSVTMDETGYCDCLHQFTDKHKCNCSECKEDNNQVVEYLKENKKGNYCD